MKTHSTITSCTTLAIGLIAITAASAADLQVPAEYPTIQDAVDAALDGDTIHIAAGVYLEQTKISRKQVTLIGQPGAILRAVPRMTRLLGDLAAVAVIGIHSHSDVNIRGLAFEGERLSGGDEIDGIELAGILNVDSAGSVENCRFTGFRAVPGGSGYGFAIHFLNDLNDAALVQVRVVGNTVVDSNVGLQIEGSLNNPRRPSVEFRITDNTFVGIGPSADEGNSGTGGIWVKRGTTGIVKNNIFSGYSFSGSPGFSTGIGAMDTIGFFAGTMQPMEPIVFEGNTFRDNQVHLFMLGGNGSTITNNTFEGTGTTPGTSPSGQDVTGGLDVTGTNVVIANNRFSGMERGIRLLDSDFLPGSPSDIGNFSGGRLVENRFCDVAKPIQREAGVTATEEGSLTCPFPDPVLIITPAVLLSWPEIEEGFSVETAPAPNGPWIWSDSTQYLQDGQYRVTVPADKDHQYFRLQER